MPPAKRKAPAKRAAVTAAVGDGPGKRLALGADRDAWAQQEGETDTEHSHFRAFLAIGDARTLAKAAEKLTKNSAYLRTIAARNRWRERARAHDDAERSAHAAHLQEQRRAVALKHLAVWELGMAVVAERVQELVDTPPARMPLGDVIKLGELCLKLSRDALGEPDTRVRVSGDPGGAPIALDVAGLDDHTRESRLRMLVAEIAARTGTTVAAAAAVAARTSAGEGPDAPGA